MQAGGHFSSGSRYGTDGIVAFAADSGKHGVLGQAFIDSAIAQSLSQMVPGKRVLDIGCGVGDWCCLVAQCGAKTVDGFDIQEEMVERAKQTTSHLDMVNIQVGDAADMPYNDDSFDVAISLFVTCNLSPDVFEKHFQELYRVLAPNGKAILLIPSDWSHRRLYTKIEADPTAVDNHIAQVLKTIPNHPTTAQITKAFNNTDDIIATCFAVDAKGDLFHVKKISQLSYGQPIWRKTDVMMFPNFFYSDKSTVIQILTAGLHIDSVHNYFTEERRIAHNNNKPKILLNKRFSEYPIHLVYHVSKPVDN